MLCREKHGSSVAAINIGLVQRHMMIFVKKEMLMHKIFFNREQKFIIFTSNGLT